MLPELREIKMKSLMQQELVNCNNNELFSLPWERRIETPINSLGKSDGKTTDLALYRELKKFRTHGLADLEKATLMNRVDTKFVIKKKHLIELLSAIHSSFSVLTINNKQIFEYRNHYFDTENMDFYNQHHNGKLNRYKVRQRHYVDSNLRFLEVKFKNNKKRTNKTRVKIVDNDYEGIDQFIQQNMGGSMPDLTTKQISGYKRIAFANERAGERITIDHDVWYQSVASDPILELDKLCIVEVKQTKMNRHGEVFSLLKKMGYKSVSFSKYCVGCALLYDETLKTNRFKPLLRKHMLVPKITKAQ